MKFFCDNQAALDITSIRVSVKIGLV